MIDTELTFKIKALGDESTGSALLELMEYCKVFRLWDVTQEQAEEFFTLKIKEIENGRRKNYCIATND